MIKIVIVTKENSYFLNNTEYQKGTLIVKHSENGVSLGGHYANVNEISCDGAVFNDKASLSDWISEYCFKPGGGSVSDGAVSSVNGKTPNESGDVTLNAPDVGAGTSNLEIGTTSTTAMAGDKTFATIAQGSLADSAVQPSALSTSLSTKADLVAGKVPESQLPSYVDNVQEYADLASFPATGESNVVYLAIDTNKPYRWGGSSYVEITSGMALGETSSTAYRGDRGKSAFDHTSLTNNPHGVTKAQVGLGNVDNTSDVNKPVSTAQATAIASKTSKGYVDGYIIGTSSIADNVTIKQFTDRTEYICMIPFSVTVPSGAARYLNVTSTRILPVGITINSMDEHYISIRNSERAVAVNVHDNTSRAIVLTFGNSWDQQVTASGTVFIKLVKYK